MGPKKEWSPSVRALYERIQANKKPGQSRRRKVIDIEAPEEGGVSDLVDIFSGNDRERLRDSQQRAQLDDDFPRPKPKVKQTMRMSSVQPQQQQGEIRKIETTQSSSGLPKSKGDYPTKTERLKAFEEAAKELGTEDVTGTKLVNRALTKFPKERKKLTFQTMCHVLYNDISLEQRKKWGMKEKPAVSERLKRKYASL